MKESETSGLPLQAMVLTNNIALATFIPHQACPIISNNGKKLWGKNIKQQRSK